MKILYHHRTASKDGQAVHIEEMIAALRDQGHEVRVVAPTPHEPDGGGGPMGTQVSWVQRLRARLPKAAYELLELGYSWVAYRKLLRAAREFKPDVLYERSNLFLLSGLMLKRRLGLPMLLEVNSPLADERLRHGGLGLPRLARWSEHATWRGADRVLPVTQVLADIIQRSAGVPAERIAVIPNGINQAHFAAAPSPAQARAALPWPDDGALVLGFTGFVRDWHGVDLVLRWMAGAGAPASSRLLVVGDGPARADLEKLAAELGLSPRLHFTGFVPRHQVPALVAAFDIALQPAVTPYASPLKLFEYLALGKAIVAPRVPNIEELLVDERNALLFDDGDPRSFERALTRLSGDAGLRGRLAIQAQATVTEKGLTWARNAQRVAQLAQDVQPGGKAVGAAPATASVLGSADAPVRR